MNRLDEREMVLRNLNRGIEPEQKEVVYEYLRTPSKERIPQAQFYGRNNINRNLFYRIKEIYVIENALEVQGQISKIRLLKKGVKQELWESQIKEAQEERQRMRLKAQAKLDRQDTLDLEEDPVGWWQKRTLELNKAILESAKKGNAQSQKLAKQLAGELVEKSEVKIGLTADELTRRQLEAERQLRELGFNRRGNESGVVKVSEELPLLPENVCLDSEQEHRADS